MEHCQRVTPWGQGNAESKGPLRFQLGQGEVAGIATLAVQRPEQIQRQLELGQIIDRGQKLDEEQIRYGGKASSCPQESRQTTS